MFVTLVAAVFNSRPHLRQDGYKRKEKPEEKGMKTEGVLEDSTIQYDFRASTRLHPPRDEGRKQEQVTEKDSGGSKDG